jgi:hypothetical protein
VTGRHGDALLLALSLAIGMTAVELGLRLFVSEPDRR